MKRKKEDKIGFIGFGEAGFEMSTGFREEGVNVNFYVVLKNKEYTNKIKEKAKLIQAKLMYSLNALALESNTIFSAVTPESALCVAESIAPYLNKSHYYVDINSTSPATKKEISEVIELQGAKFIEAAVMDAVPSRKQKVPMLICGKASKTFFKKMQIYKMNLTIIEGSVGSAMLIKMLRSIFMKGLAALLIETLGAAHKCDLTSCIYNSIEETLKNRSFFELVNRLICGTSIHAARRKYEMKEVIDTLKSLDSEHIMSEATKDLLDWVSLKNLKDNFRGVVPNNYYQVLDAIVK